MAEVLNQYPDVIVSEDGVRYVAQATGASTPGGSWEAWIEFLPIEGGVPVRTPRETTQPNQTDAEYWATGLTAVYLEGALRRALDPIVRREPVPSRPLFERAGPDLLDGGAMRVPTRSALLDPYSVYGKGELLLRQELQALAPWHLVNIIQAYDLSAEPASVLNGLPSRVLIDLIVEAVAHSSR
jgi:hypothetical protein